MRTWRKAVMNGALALVALAALVGCDDSDRAAPAPTPDAVLGDDAVTVAAFDFTESELLAEIYGQALEGRGYSVIRAGRLGPREFVGPALQRGLIEFVPEYASTAAGFYSLGAADDADDATAALTQSLAGGPLEALTAAPAENANTFVVTAATADRHGLRTLSDLAAVSPSLTFGGPPECPSRPRCLAGLRRVYGIEFQTAVPLDTGGPTTLQALRTGAIDVGLLFSTDPALLDPSLVALTDDRKLQGAENVIPVVRSEVVDRHGSAFVAAIDAVSTDLTTTALRQLNADAATRPIPDVARRWLEEHSRS